MDDCQEMEDVNEDDFSLPDIDKYAQKETFGEVDDCQDIEEFNSNSNEDDEILEQQLSDEEDDVRIEEILSEEEEQQTQDTRNRFSSRAKKDRRKDSRTFTNLKKRAKAEAQNYEIRVKSDKKNYITYQVKNLRNTEIYQVTFDEKDVTCNCKSFKEIEERRECAANEVCKHVALIPLYCHENVRENYNGQRWFSTRGAFVRVSEMLKSFDITRNIWRSKNIQIFTCTQHQSQTQQENCCTTRKESMLSVKVPSCRFLCGLQKNITEKTIKEPNQLANHVRRNWG